MTLSRHQRKTVLGGVVLLIVGILDTIISHIHVTDNIWKRGTKIGVFCSCRIRALPFHIAVSVCSQHNISNCGAISISCEG